MTAIYTYRQPRYDGLMSSPEILAAIEEIAGDNICDSNSDAYAIWSDPTPEQMAEVERIAWSLSDADKDSLHWGSTTITRAAHR